MSTASTVAVVTAGGLLCAGANVFGGGGGGAGTRVIIAPDTVLGGDYRLIKPLSSGGMGSVHLAEQVSTGTRRAVKLMHAQLLENTRARDRFVQEARASGRIPSDHVVQVLAAGVDDALGVPFIVMELLEGETLDRRIDDQGPLLAGELADFTDQLFHAVSAAHEVGVVHRDLKPENVFLARTRRARAKLTVKVLDFGIAKLLAEVTTAPTAGIGTPLWMAPEQSEADHVVTPATDVWALGLLYFYLFSGKPYWRTAESGNLQALMREVVLDPLVPASERAKQLDGTRELPDGFDEVFARAVVREPKSRFTDAREMQSAIEAILPGSPRRAHTTAPSPKRAAPTVDQADAATADTLDTRAEESATERESVPTTANPAISSTLPQGLQPKLELLDASDTVTIRKPVPAQAASRTTQPTSLGKRQESTARRSAIAALATAIVGALVVSSLVSEKPTNTSNETTAQPPGLPGTSAEPSDAIEPALPEDQDDGDLQGGGPPAEIATPSEVGSALPDVTPADSAVAEAVDSSSASPATSALAVASTSARPPFRGAPAARAPAPSAPVPATPGAGTLRVTARPGFCNVSIDGLAYGPTPLAVPLAVGKRTVTCAADDGSIRSQQVDIEDEKTARIVFNLAEQ